MERIFNIRNRLLDLPPVLDGVEEFCLARGVAKETALDLRLVAEEILTNIVKYAHTSSEEHSIELRLSASADTVRMEFRDSGAPFNPLDAPAPELDARSEEREIGGLGIHLVRSLVDEATYSREDRFNILILMRRLGSTV